MSLSLTTLKFGLVASLSAGTAGVIGYGTYNILINPSTTQHNNLIVVDSSVVPSGTASSTQPQGQAQNKDYKCKISNSDQVATACNLVKLNIQNNWIDLTGIKNAKQSSPIDFTKLTTPNNYFKLEVDATFFSKVDFFNNKSISITWNTEAQVQSATLNTLFKLDNSGVHYDKTPHLLGKATTAVPSITSGDSFECLFTNSTAAATGKSCSLYSFGTVVSSLSGAGYSNQNATNLLQTTAPSSLEADKYYVVEYKTALDKATIANNHNVWINKVVTPGTNTSVTSLNNVVPAIVTGASASKIAFILSETPAYSVVVQKTDAIADAKTLTHNQTTKTYQCRLASASPVNCTLVPLPFTASTKTSLTLEAVKAAAITSNLSITNSDTKPSFFRLDVGETFFNSFKTPSINTQTIHVVEKKDGETIPTVLFALDPLFSIEDPNSLHFETSTFIVKSADHTAANVSNGAITSGKKTFCSFTNTDKGGDDAKECTLIDLGTTVADTADIQSSTAATTIATANTYLVKFASPNEKGLPKNNKGSNDFFILEEGDDQTPAKRKQVAKFTADNVEPAIIVDGASPHQFAFRLA